MWDKRSKDIDGMMCVLMLRQRWEAHHLVWITKKVTEKDLDDLSKMQEVKKKTQKKREGKNGIAGRGSQICRDRHSVKN